VATIPHQQDISRGSYNPAGLLFKTTFYVGSTTIDGQHLQSGRERLQRPRQLTRQYQEHQAVPWNEGSSPHVDYAYTEMAGALNNSRLTP